MTTLEEFLHTLIRRARSESGAERASLGAPPSLVEEANKILWHENAYVTPFNIVNFQNGAEIGGDQFSIRCGDHLRVTYWIPGLSSEGLEAYHTLRYDGTPRDTAREIASALHPHC